MKTAIAFLSPAPSVRVLTLCLVLVCAGTVRSQSLSALPRLKRQGTATQLIVQDKPFLMLGGELGNSSPSDVRYMAPIWPRLREMHLNTVLMPVSWELIEPRDGMFEFTLVDSLVTSARRDSLKIVILWFGSWKNSMSCYAPSWVKTNQERFPRARTSDGRAVEILTPFSEANRDADAKAFAALMKHVRAFDRTQQTVVMIQVENEIGMIPQARDYCREAEDAFSRQVPSPLIAYLRKNQDSLTTALRQAWGANGMKTTGTWEQVFGEGVATDELTDAHLSLERNLKKLDNGAKQEKAGD